ncbi:HNHc domain containing protein [Planktothrix phage Pra-JY27]|nr:CRISPR-associated endonuclease Cas9/Csn1 family [Planktothrix phage Pag-Yong1]WEV89245.1 HNH endonuclease signature motif containing protein [Synechococcus phage MinM2]
MPSLRQVCERHGWRCVYCDATATTIDHVIPRAEVRKKRRPDWMASINSPENLMPACEECNNAKGRQNIRQFLHDRPDRLARIVRAMARINPRAVELLGESLETQNRHLTLADMRRAIGVMVDALARAAFRGGSIDQQEAHDLLVAAGMAKTRPATAKDVASCPHGATEPGDPWTELTRFAKECRYAATRPVQAEPDPFLED